MLKQRVALRFLLPPFAVGDQLAGVAFLW